MELGYTDVEDCVKLAWNSLEIRLGPCWSSDDQSRDRRPVLCRVQAEWSSCRSATQGICVTVLPLFLLLSEAGYPGWVQRPHTELGNAS